MSTATGLTAPKRERDGEEPDAESGKKRRQREQLSALITMQANLHSLNEVMQKPDVKKILEDLSNLPAFQMPKSRRHRRPLKQQGHLTDAGEVYSPPRVAAAASNMGFKAA